MEEKTLIEEIASTEMIPTSMIVKYTSNSDSFRATYFELHDIKNGKPGAARPLTQEDVNNIASDMATKQTKYHFYCKGLLPKKVVSFNFNKSKLDLIWTYAAQKTRIKFHKRTNVESGNFVTPYLIFKLIDEELFVYALDGFTISEKTVLFHAPFPNIYDGGRVCLGSSKIEKHQEINKIMDHWEKVFFMSEFTAEVHNKDACNQNVFSVWKSLLNNEKPFPLNVLVPTKLTLKDIL